MAFFTDYNWEGPWNSLQFNEEMINYMGLAASNKLGFIIDVKALKIVGNQAEVRDVGWTYLNIYEMLENENGVASLYTNTGLHAVSSFMLNHPLL